MKLAKSHCVALLIALAFGLCARDAEAQAFPNRPLKMVVGFSAGGGTDVVARIVANKMGEILGQSVVVENRGGASGMIGAEAVAKAAPDGYTLMMGSQTTYAVAPNLYRKFAFDPAKEFVGVALTGASPLVVVVNPSSPIHTIKDLIAMAKAKPGTINFGSGGLGTTPHMAGELFSMLAGIKMVHVAYRGEAPAINDVIAGQVQVIFANLSAVIGNVRGGTLRALAVTSAQRSPSAPEIPTVAEAAIPGFEAATWFGIVAPAGTPHDILVKLNGAARRALADQDTGKRFLELGMTNGSSSPEELDAYIKSEIAKWSKVITDADIKAPE
jgi:tripartite-type tricarboxylate transporter receptor subunit TctC